MADKKTVAITFAFLVIWIVVAVFFALPLLQQGTEHYIVFRQATTLENRGSQPFQLTASDKGLPLPLNSTLYGMTQNSYLRTSSHQIVERTADDDENPIAILDLRDEIESGGSLVFSATYEVKIKSYHPSAPRIEHSGKLRDIPQDLQEQYCAGVGAWFTNNSILQETVEFYVSPHWRGQDSNVLQLVFAVANSVRYQIRFKETTPLYPNATLEVGYGTCRERTGLIATLLRILGIPAYFQMGFIYYEGYMGTEFSYEGHVTTGLDHVLGWHAWAVAYVPPWGWIPIDTADEDVVSDALVLKMITVQFANILATDYINSFQKTLEEFTNGNRKDVYIYISQDAKKMSTNDYWTRGWVLIVGSAIAIIIAWTYVTFWVRKDASFETSPIEGIMNKSFFHLFWYIICFIGKNRTISTLFKCHFYEIERWTA